MAKIRTFIAVKIPDALKREVDKLIVGLKPHADGVRWVKAANLHFTIRFLGDIESDSISNLENILAENLKNIKPFSIKLSSLGCFPNIRRPRVVWVGAAGDMDDLKELAYQVESACRQGGFGKSDKPFSAHLTIGRIKYPKGLEAFIDELQETEFESDVFEVSEVVVFKSDLSRRGPTYTPMIVVGL
ncbi:MAG: RNA 2',3'-cyclic phosphodiesterase [candidate division Zixibacteria bacterium]|nr:RNA 2',3'-cyclic phosphodiesterase [candidate division Zixibacteria bacterium]